MSEARLTPVAVPSPYPGSAADLVFTAADASAGNDFISTGREIVICRNDDAAPQMLTITSAPDPYGRTGSIAKTIAAGAFAVFPLLPTVGFQQSDGAVSLTASSANLKVAVIRLP